MLRRGDMAGAEIVVVKDGQVLFEKGYGVADVASRRPVDPHTTLFRTGSTAKLFTWTAVMQLVEQGRLDLDTDINRYLDFRIPERFGKPITLRNLLTHRPGFEETFKSIEVRDQAEMPTLEQYIKAWTPTRIYPPGEVPAYSNYGASLAGYIVQRVSGQRYEDYVRDHIFLPLGMTRATLDQHPRPGDGRATGYILASQPPHGFEYVGDIPAGALSITADDMARFMLAHLGGGQWNGRRILADQTERRMLAPSFAAAPGFDSMALGFYGQNRNGHRVVGHGGDLMAFHTGLHLLPDDHVGLYIATNSLGVNVSSSALRDAVFRGFMDRYFPAAVIAAATWPSARADGAKLVGTYEASRQALDTFASLGGLLGQGTMKQLDDGRLEFSRFTEPGGAPSIWREIRPMVWQNEDASSLMSATLRDGKVATILSNQQPPAIVWTPAPASRSSVWNVPLLGLTVLILFGAIIFWALRPIVRRALASPAGPNRRARRLYHLASAGAVAQFAYLAGWVALIGSASSDPSILSPSLDPWLRLIQLAGVIGLSLGLAGIGALVLAWRERPRRWWTRIGLILLSGAWAGTLWLTVAFHLITATLQY
jgi:CubicO group peptidase (beta-lactamase class C family)